MAPERRARQLVRHATICCSQRARVRGHAHIALRYFSPVPDAIVLPLIARAISEARQGGFLGAPAFSAIARSCMHVSP